MGLHAKNFTGEHIYAQSDRSPGKWFLILVDIYAAEDDFYELQIWTHNLLASITSAQIEIILNAAYPKSIKILRELIFNFLRHPKSETSKHKIATPSVSASPQPCS
jgi:sRNA-binding carbon storage regulator CsrA